MITEPTKKSIFISHIHEEKEVALAFKELVEFSFLNLIHVFVSSDGDSISMGDRWLDSISRALQNCAVEIIVCSHISVTRPWIQFEGGAGWIRGIPVVPLCHSGMKPTNLPIPFKLLNGAVASEDASVKSILPTIAKALGSSTPYADLNTYLSRVSKFERRYTFWDKCNRGLKLVQDLHAEVLPNLKIGNRVTVTADLRIVEQLEMLADFLREHKIVNYLGRKCMVMDVFPKIEMGINPMENLLSTLAASECELKD